MAAAAAAAAVTSTVAVTFVVASFATLLAMLSGEFRVDGNSGVEDTAVASVAANAGVDDTDDDDGLADRDDDADEDAEDRDADAVFDELMATVPMASSTFDVVAWDGGECVAYLWLLFSV